MSTAPDEYGVFGHPVTHSLSPFIHGMFARETGQHMSYRPFEVAPEEFADCVHAFFAHGGRGLNITLPHKVAAAGVAQHLTERAAHAAAVNTLTMQDGLLIGDNTDGVGLVRDLCDNLGVVITNRRLLVLGAGGATRGILAPLLALAPDRLVIANRTAERAAALAAAFADVGPAHGVGFAEVEDAPFDLIVNATSASLSGAIPPLPAGVVGPQSVCYDLAYGRAAGAFVQWARAAGAAQALQGLGMLVEQAAESFRVWRGVKPETAHVRAALRQRVGLV